MSSESLPHELVKSCKCSMVSGLCNLMNHLYNEDKPAIGQAWTELDRLCRTSSVTLSSLCSRWHIISLTMLIPSDDTSLLWSIASCLKFNYQRTTYFQSLQGAPVTSMDCKLRPGSLILSLQCFQLHPAASPSNRMIPYASWGCYRRKMKYKNAFKGPCEYKLLSFEKSQMDHFAILQLYQIKWPIRAEST